MTKEIVWPTEPCVTNAMEETTMLGAASNRRIARKKHLRHMKVEEHIGGSEHQGNSR